MSSLLDTLRSKEAEGSEPLLVNVGGIEAKTQEPKKPSTLLEHLKDIERTVSPQDALKEGAKSGAVIGGGALAGGSAGARMGAIAGPWGAGAGFIVGSAVGAGVADWGAEKLGITTPMEAFPEDVRPQYAAGETFVSTAVSMNLPFTLRTGLFGKGRVGGYIDEMISLAKANPKKTIGIELVSGGAAATAGGVSEELDPGDPITRGLAETVAGIFAPGKMATQLTITAFNKLSGPLNRFTSSGRQDEVVKQITTLMERYGEDPDKLVEMINSGILRDKDGVVIPLSSSQQSGSVAIAHISGLLEYENSDLAQSIGAKSLNGLKAIETLIDELNRTGDASLMQTAAELKQDYFRTILLESVNKAHAEALTAASAITSEKSSSLAEFGIQAYEIVNESLKGVRKMETSLYDLVEHTTITSAARTKNALLELTSNRARTADPIKHIHEFLEDIEKGDMSTAYAINVRGELLASSRKAEREGDSKMAGLYSKLAESVLEDVDRVLGNDNVYNDARTFSRELNDVFTRSFAGKIESKGVYGDVISPEVVLEKATAGGRGTANRQLMELEAAIEFAEKKGAVEPGAVSDMLEVQERTMRLLSAELFNNLDGMLRSPEQLATFMNRPGTKDLLERFPTLKKQMEEAIEGKRNYDAVVRGIQIDGQTLDSNFVEKTSLFAKLTPNNEYPEGQLARVLSKGNLNQRYADLDEIVHMARNNLPEGVSLEDANKSISTVIWDGVLKTTNRKNEVFDYKATRSMLFDPPSKGQPSLIQYMKDAGLVDQAHIDNLESLFTTMAKVDEATKTGKRLRELDLGVDFATELAIRVGSANVGANIRQASGTQVNSLLLDAAAIRFGQNLLAKLPAGKTREVFAEAMDNPEFLTLIMNKEKDTIKQIENIRQIHAHIMASIAIGSTEVSTPYIDQVYEPIAQKLNQGEPQ